MYVVWNGGRPIVILSKPKVIDDTIINNGMRDGSLVRSKGVRKAWNDITSSPILLGETGTEWQWRGKVWNPEFSSSSLSKYLKIINQACEQVIETIRSTTSASDVEVDPQVCPNQSSINIENLKELAYIRAIIKETLRLYSVGSGSTSLETQRDTVIEGKVIPRGTRVSWSMLAAGRDPEVYANPEEFLPERWLENNKESNVLPMIDFGSGSHRCLGEHLSMLEATMMLALLILNFDWELVNGRSSLEQLQQNILIYPSDKMPVRFRLRNNKK